MLRPWSERNQPVAGGDNSFNAPVQAAPVRRFPQGMRPSCSDEVVVRPVPGWPIQC